MNWGINKQAMNISPSEVPTQNQLANGWNDSLAYIQPQGLLICQCRTTHCHTFQDAPSRVGY